MTEIAAVADRFASGELVLVGDEHDETISGAAAAAVELGRISERSSAVALCAVLDRDGTAASVSVAQQDRQLARLPALASGELHSRSISRAAETQAIGCHLPTRDGLFRALAYGPAERDPATVALIHGDPAGTVRPLVHLHVACLFGDAFGSPLCRCRDELDAATAAMIAEGAGVIVYAKPAAAEPWTCAREAPVDSALAAGLLRAAGVRELRLAPGSARLTEELESCGLAVQRV